MLKDNEHRRYLFELIPTMNGFRVEVLSMIEIYYKR